MQIHFGFGSVTFVAERLRIGNPLLDSAAIVGVGTDPPKKNIGFGILPMRRIERADQNSLRTLVSVHVTLSHERVNNLVRYFTNTVSVKTSVH